MGWLRHRGRGARRLRSTSVSGRCEEEDPARDRRGRGASEQTPRTVARASYVHPRVPDSWVAGTLLDAFAGAAAADYLSQSEVAVLGVVADET